MMVGTFVRRAELRQFWVALALGGSFGCAHHDRQPGDIFKYGAVTLVLADGALRLNPIAPQPRGANAYDPVVSRRR